ncbi:MAG: DUF4230 domain-containing protein [Solobacterium sp.]|nr:DUF4230 domain-containing protein [Solobacterium sp.]
MDKALLILLVVALSFALGMIVNRRLSLKKPEDDITSSMIETKLTECSDLTTCLLEYVDLVKFESGSIPLINKRSFTMIYSANIRCGIDLSEAVVTVTPSEIRVSLPQTELQSIDVDTDSLKFYDEHNSLFNWNDKDDISEAIKAAREDAKKNANIDKLKQRAREQAETVIRKLLEPTAGKNRRIVIQ